MEMIVGVDVVYIRFYVGDGFFDLPILLFFFICFVVLFLFIFVLVLISHHGTNRKLQKKQIMAPDSVPYFRDITCDTIEEAFWIGTYYGIITNISDFIGAMLLKWIKEDHLDVDEDQDGKTIIDMNKLFKTDIGIESSIYVKLLACSGDNRILEEREFQNFFQNNEGVLKKIFDQMSREVKSSLIKKGLLIREIDDKGREKFITTKALDEKALQLCGLKRFLNDFSNMENRESIQVHLWDDYLIYAQMFGIADKVEEELVNIYPDYIKTMRLNQAKIALVGSAVLSLQLSVSIMLAMVLGVSRSD